MNSTTAVVTELQLSMISDDVGTCWQKLGPTLRITYSKLCNLDEECKTNWEKAYKLLMKWKEENGTGALVGRLADHLKEIGRTDIAEKLLGQHPTSSSGDCDSLTEKRNLKSEVDKLRIRQKDLEHEQSTLRARVKELENGRQQKEEVDKLRIRQKDLEHEMSTLQALHKELENGGQQKRECKVTDASKEAEQEERERRVSEILEKCKEGLELYVAQPLKVPEVRYDNLPSTAVTVDVLKVISQHLEQQYNTALDIAREACQCSEDLRKCFHDFAYRALQAENNEMNLKVENLKKPLKEAPNDYKEEFENLKRLKKRRNDLVKKLGKWKRLFSPPKPPRRVTVPTGKKPEQSRNKEKRRETFPKRNKGRDHTRDEEKPLLPSDNEGEEDVEEPPK